MDFVSRLRSEQAFKGFQKLFEGFPKEEAEIAQSLISTVMPLSLLAILTMGGGSNSIEKVALTFEEWVKTLRSVLADPTEN